MSVLVDYNDGQGYRSELTGIDLETINGPGSMPPTFKFGFAASTGGSNNIHSISDLTVETNAPSVSVELTHDTPVVQGSSTGFSINVRNAASAESTEGTITVEQTLPADITPTDASGAGWSCSIDGQDVTCSRPGDGADALAPGATTPPIGVTANVADDAASSLSSTATVDTINNISPSTSDTDNITVLNGSYLDEDEIFNAVEDAAPNDGDGNDDGIEDSTQSNVTSLSSGVTDEYVTLESSGCGDSINTNVAINPASDNTTADSGYNYPLGMASFWVTCEEPGDTATVTLYFYGENDTTNMVARKYNADTDTYTTIEDAAISAVEMDGGQAIKLEYQVTDGGPLDEDGLENGIIVDPVGLAVSQGGNITPDNNGGANSSGGVLANTGQAAQLIALLGLGIIGLSFFAYKKSQI